MMADKIKKQTKSYKPETKEKRKMESMNNVDKTLIHISHLHHRKLIASPEPNQYATPTTCHAPNSPTVVFFATTFFTLPVQPQDKEWIIPRTRPTPRALL